MAGRADANAHVGFKRFVAEVASRYTQAIVSRYLRELPAPA